MLAWSSKSGGGGDGQDNALEVARNHGVFVVNGPKCRLALLGDREDRPNLGRDSSPPHIDVLHRSMLLWKEERRQDLVDFLIEHAVLDSDPFWKLAQSLFEVLPRDLEDWRLISTLLGERQILRMEGRSAKFSDAQPTLFSTEDDTRSHVRNT